jgi:hypothetical protein
MAVQAPVVMEGARLRLRRSAPGDAGAIFAMASDAK